MQLAALLDCIILCVSLDKGRCANDRRRITIAGEVSHTAPRQEAQEGTVAALVSGLERCHVRGGEMACLLAIGVGLKAGFFWHYFDILLKNGPIC